MRHWFRKVIDGTVDGLHRWLCRVYLRTICFGCKDFTSRKCRGLYAENGYK